MNVVELTFARHLLLWPAGLIPVNLAVPRARLDRGGIARSVLACGRGCAGIPSPIDAHFHDCLTLTYALPADVLRPLLPPGLELETFRRLRLRRGRAGADADRCVPPALPSALGQDFFLAGYRVFTTFRRPDGRALRGLRILRSDAESRGAWSPAAIC